MRRTGRISIPVVLLLMATASGVWGAERKVVRIWRTETQPQSVQAFQPIITVSSSSRRRSC